jgi:hypothetical protein
MEKRLLFLITFSIFVFPLISGIDDSIPIQIQTPDASGNVITGTFEFVINISNSDNCSSILYSDTTTMATDSRGIVSYSLENVNIPFDEQYYFCYYRGGDLKQNVKIGRTPYAFNSKFLGGYDENFFLPLNTSAVGTFSGITSGDSQLLDSFDSSFFMPLNTSVVGNFDFNGGWTSGGFSILNGDIYAQTGYFYNITGLDVSTLKVNGSILPQSGFDNQFDIGSTTLRWRDLWLGRNLNVSDTLTGNNANFAGNVGIGTTSPSEILHVIGNTLFEGILNVTGEVTATNYTDATGDVLGAWHLIETQTASNDVDITFTATSAFDGTYKSLVVKAINVAPAADLTNGLRMQVSVSGTFQAGGSDYDFTNTGRDSTGVGTGNDNTATTSIRLTSSNIMGGAAGETGTFEIIIPDPSDSSSYKVISYKGGFVTGSGILAMVTGLGRYKATSAIDGIRFQLWDSSERDTNITSGTFKLYGIK